VRAGRWARRVDLVDEALASALSRPGRAALTSFGAAVGIGALVATVGIAHTAATQILARFDELEATTVVATAFDESAPAEARPDPSEVRHLPFEADGRLTRLAGVRAAGSVSRLEVGPVTGVVVDPLAAPQLAVAAASPGLLGAVRGELLEGRWIDPFHDRAAAPVAVLGRAAATRLGITRVDAQPTVLIGATPFVVIGLLDRVEREHGLLDAVIIPEGTAARWLGLRGPTRIVVETQVGAAVSIADQVPLALVPSDPAAVAIRAPVDLSELRSGAARDVNTLFVLLSAVILAVGALGIADVTLVAVFERVGEIGLRRALGGTRGEVAAQVLLETTLLGLLGGSVGMAGGVLVVLGAAAAQAWTPVLDLRLCGVAPLLGATVGLLAGLYPARRAAAIEPARAVRRDLG
jgi:ABC-type antimicrobial peptide transport system permease subunit